MHEPVAHVRWMPLTVAVPLALSATCAVATDYLSVEQAQRQMFPQASAFASQPVTASPALMAQLAARLGAPVRPAQWSIVAAMAGDQLLGYVVTDGVVGKFEIIQYAVALSPHADILDVEILSYREAHGGEVRTRAWRQQFVGKSASAALTVGNDIANISGATLSCTHLTDGVRRIATYAQLVLARP